MNNEQRAQRSYLLNRKMSAKLFRRDIGDMDRFIVRNYVIYS